MSQVLDEIKRIRTNKVGDALEKFADIVSRVESNNENVRQEGGGPGRGFYQYEMQAGSKKPQGAKTALNRYKRFLDQNNLTMPESYARELKSKNFDPNDPDFTKLSRELQTEIFYADKQEDPDFKLTDLASGTLSYQNAWLDHHWKGPDKDREDRTNHYNRVIKNQPPLPEPRPERDMPPLPEPRPRRESEKDFPPQAINPPPSPFRFDESSTINSSDSDSTITGGAAEDSLDAQMAEAMGSIPVETDPSRYRTVPEEKLTEGEPLNSRELLESPTQQEVRPAYTEDELAREAYVDPESARRQQAFEEGTGVFAPESTGDQTIGDMLRSFFGTNEEADTYEGPTGEADPANFAHGGPVEKELEVTEDDLPDPPPGATPEEVADDIPAYLSTGEYVLPANVVRYYGLSRISDLHKNALFELQQMEDLGIIQNVDHNGKEEDDDDEMDFIQEPETLVVVESSKGLMHPMHFERGGTDKGDENDQSETDDGPSMAEQADADQASDPAETGTAQAAEQAEADMAAADLEKAVTEEVQGLFGTGLTAEKMVGYTSLGRMFDIGKAVIGGLTQGFQGLEKAGYNVDFPGEEDYSGFGKGKDIGGDDGSRGGGGDDLDNLMAEETSNLPKITTSVRRYTPVGIIDTAPKKGIMRAAEGGMAYVPEIGFLGAGQNVFEETASELKLPSLSFDEFTADVFGFGKVPNVDTLGPKKAVEEFTKNKFEEYKTKPPLTGADLQTRVKSAKEFTPRSVLGTDGQGPSASNEYAKDKELRRILINRGVDGQDFADVINNYRAGQRQILPNSSPLSNEQLISELDALSNSRRVTREGVTSSDIPEGATNRDVLKGIFAPQISSLERYDSRNRQRTGKEDLIEAIVTSDSLGEKYGYNLDDPADPDTLNKIVNFANSETYSPDYTPENKGYPLPSSW
jgi:hypothetical protein